MPLRWDSSFEPPSRRDTALLSEVLNSLRAQLTGPEVEGEASPGVEELISAAISELHRLSPPSPPAVGFDVVAKIRPPRPTTLLRCSTSDDENALRS
jgi:hypothetical protein